jgi:SAM-dependent methyltransferase
MTMDPVDLAEMALSLPEIDPDKPSPARVYDYWLGGSQNFAADREIGRRTAEVMPHIPAAARANRAFLTRVVRNLVEKRGITQFLDLGSGVPTAGNVHEVARRVNPDARIVYVDMDPVAIAHSRALLADVPGTEAILADVRRPEAVLAHPLLHDTLDFDRPVAVLMFAVMHFIPDTDRPWALIRDYMRPVASGSYFAFSHGIPGGASAQTQASAARAYADRTGVPFISRPPEQLAEWLADPSIGLELLAPGLVSIAEWLPEPDADPGYDPGYDPLVCGVLARKR